MDLMLQDVGLWWSLLEQLPVWTVIIDRDHRLAFINHTPPGISMQDLLGTSVYDTIEPVRREDLRARIDAAFRGAPCAPLEAPAFGPSASRGCHELHFSSLERDGDTVAVVAVAIDITERRQTEAARLHFDAQLRHAQKLESLGVLAGGIAHDFNNVLMGVLANADFALDALGPTHPVRGAVQDMRDAAASAAGTTRQLLAYAGRAPIESRVVDVSQQVRETSNLLRLALPKTVQIHHELADDLPPVQADVAQLQQVMMNIVINAAEAYHGAAGTVQVETSTESLDLARKDQLLGGEDLVVGRYVVLRVQDRGCGLDEETRLRMFDPFFTTKARGRGLGLAAVAGIVRSHGGAVQVHSTPGRGTTFEVYLPTVLQR